MNFLLLTPTTEIWGSLWILWHVVNCCVILHSLIVGLIFGSWFFWGLCTTEKVSFSAFAFSALTVVVGHQEEHPIFDAILFNLLCLKSYFWLCNVVCCFDIYLHFWSAEVLKRLWLRPYGTIQICLLLLFYFFKLLLSGLKIEWWGVDVVIYLEQVADCLHMVQLMPLPCLASLHPD